MAGAVHYKFKSSRNFNSVSFDGAFIKVGLLKRTIADQEGLLKNGGNVLDLLLTNAQDGTGLLSNANMIISLPLLIVSFY